MHEQLIKAALTLAVAMAGGLGTPLLSANRVWHTPYQQFFDHVSIIAASQDTEIDNDGVCDGFHSSSASNNLRLLPRVLARALPAEIGRSVHQPTPLCLGIRLQV
jgi:hypothetical protein